VIVLLFAAASARFARIKMLFNWYRRERFIHLKYCTVHISKPARFILSIFIFASIKAVNLKA
jgi:hypothetical protein